MYGFRLFLIYGSSGNREMPRICVPTANPPRFSTRQHQHGSCSLLGIGRPKGVIHGTWELPPSKLRLATVFFAVFCLWN